MMRFVLRSGLALLLAAMGLPAFAQGKARKLDDFEQVGAWTVATSDQVSGKLRMAEGHDGKALCLDYDFNGVSGYAAMQRELPLDYPDNYAFTFQLRGDSPANDLQFKLVDDSGDNVWWVNRTHFEYPKQWTPVVYKKRHISRAWGPAPDPTLRHSRKIEFTIYNRIGGKGSVCFDELSLRTLPPEDHSPLTGQAAATAQESSAPAANAIDGNIATAWKAPLSASPQWRLDLRRMREFGGVVLRWLPGLASTSYRIELSDDGREWRLAREVKGSDGGNDYIALPESEARYLRLTTLAGEGSSIGLAEFVVQPLAFSATPNDFLKAVASEAKRGAYPRGFSGEQPYWTIVGIDGGDEQGLIGEDGAIELGKGAFSIEPVVVTPAGIADWSNVDSKQSLQDGYLPIPSVEWQRDDLRLRVTSFAQGTRAQSQLVGRYRLTNPTQASGRLHADAADTAVAGEPAQPVPQHGRWHQPDPSPGHRGWPRGSRTKAQAGGASQSLRGRYVTTFDAADAPVQWRADAVAVDDPTGLASGAMSYTVRLGPGESFETDWIAPLTGAFPAPLTLADAEAMQRQVAAQWRDKLDRVKLRVPEQGQKVVDTLRTGLAHMLISRIGPRLQPGTRSYSRAWIRDGAMIGEGLLRMGREDVAEEFLRWYAPYQFNNGKVPCCVDDRGSDPVPENDSHGELIFTVAEVYRYTRDRALLESMWPHVQGAVKYMDQLRLSERTEANRARDPAFYGMMPASISHEGYSAKPMHSYWDNFWALRGYKDAVEIAQWLGHDADAVRLAAAARPVPRRPVCLAGGGDASARHRLPARSRGTRRFRRHLLDDRAWRREENRRNCRRTLLAKHLRTLLA